LFRVDSSSRSRNGGPNRLGDGPGRPAWADWPRPISARFGRRFAHVGPLVVMHFAPSICTIFDDVILVSKMEGLLA
jgi:hypothetical protein